VRRRAILAAAAGMLAEMPVADVSLTELSRRVGLAKSNVLRYFDSREAVLLELLDDAWRDWLAGLAADLGTGSCPNGPAGPVGPVGPAGPAGSGGPAGPDSPGHPAGAGGSAGRDAAGEAAGPGGSAGRDAAGGAVGPGGSGAERRERVAAAVAGSLAARPVLCDLLGAQAAVLERNVSAAVAARFKRAAIDNVAALGRLLAAALPELGGAAAERLAAATVLVAGALWAHGQPSAAVLAAYAADPSLAVFRVDFGATLTEVIAVLIAGLIARGTP
jgi:AcrR family transcriptional regulator